jgi:hypothetical protein
MVVVQTASVSPASNILFTPHPSNWVLIYVSREQYAGSVVSGKLARHSPSGGEDRPAFSGRLRHSAPESRLLPPTATAGRNKQWSS